MGAHLVKMLAVLRGNFLQDVETCKLLISKDSRIFSPGMIFYPDAVDGSEMRSPFEVGGLSHVFNKVIWENIPLFTEF